MFESLLEAASSANPVSAAEDTLSKLRGSPVSGFFSRYDGDRKISGSLDHNRYASGKHVYTVNLENREEPTKTFRVRLSKMEGDMFWRMKEASPFAEELASLRKGLVFTQDQLASSARSWLRKFIDRWEEAKPKPSVKERLAKVDYD